MFDSGKSVSELITEIQNETDIALEIPTTTYINWLNIVEQLCYTEIIKEQREIDIINPTSPISISALTVLEGEEPVRFEDIYTIYADFVQLTKTTLASGYVFPNTFFKKNNDIGFSVDAIVGEIKIIYFAKPKLKTSVDGNVMLPIEFIDMVKAKLRGEAYKLANEDALASKWLNDYNVMLENFKTWCNNKSSQFGM